MLEAATLSAQSHCDLFRLKMLSCEHKINYRTRRLQGELLVKAFVKAFSANRFEVTVEANRTTKNQAENSQLAQARIFYLIA